MDHEHEFALDMTLLLRILNSQDFYKQWYNTKSKTESASSRINTIATVETSTIHNTWLVLATDHELNFISLLSLTAFFTMNFVMMKLCSTVMSPDTCDSPSVVH